MNIHELLFYGVLGLLLNAVLIQFLYHLAFFLRLSLFGKARKLPQTEIPVSVVLAARNEYENLEKNLPLILEQSYSQFEVVVINDCSWDQTGPLLERLQQQYSHLKVVTLHEQEKYPKGKKFALTLGIKAAQFEYLLLTDADCRPLSPNWIRHMAAAFGQKKEIVLGYSPYAKRPGLLNLFIRYETFMTALSYFSLALSGVPYMGVGRNLAYRRSLFFSVKGFANHNHLISGDDDLFVNETARQGNVAIEISKDAFMVSEPKENFASWKNQKLRHLSTGKYYKTAHKFWLALHSISTIVFYIALTAGWLFTLNLPDLPWLAMDFWLMGLGSLMLFRWIWMMAIFFSAMKKLGEFRLWPFIPFLDGLFAGYLLVFGIVGFFHRPKTWS